MSQNNRNQDSIPSPSTPAAPPPPYTEFAAGPSSSLSVPFLAGRDHLSPVNVPPPRFHPTPMSTATVPQGPSLHPGYGPTPLGTNQPLLPYAYYESRGSADARARWRFIQAFSFAMVVWMLLGFIITIEILGDEGWLWKACIRKFGLDGVVRAWVWMQVSNSGLASA
ncbi:hypothetical protein AN958_05614 [Leucoagaricus sp. SymC.cos]|nr:hypothetical protein AN958_05614 [Leucoagaricus sp. SymC.cos]